MPLADGHSPAAALLHALKRGTEAAWIVVKVVFPLSILVSILRDSGLLAEAASLFVPLMKYFDLPGEAALGLISGNIGNIYTGLAFITPLHLPARQVTILGLMFGLSHTLVIETAVVRQMGAPAWKVTCFRIGAGIAAGLFLAWVMPA